MVQLKQWDLLSFEKNFALHEIYMLLISFYFYNANFNP